MRKYAIYVTAATLALGSIVWAFRSASESDQTSETIILDSLFSENSVAVLTKNKNGKEAKRNHVFRKIYSPSKLDSFSMPSLSSKLLKALDNQLALLQKQPAKRQIGDLNVSVEDMARVIDLVRHAKSGNMLKSQLKAYQICGDDKRGNVRFTGYYSPIIDARYKRVSGFTHPIYLRSKRKGDLEVVYVSEKQDIQSMRIEGTAYLKFPDGRKQLVAFTGDYERTSSYVNVVEDDDDNQETKKVLAKYAAVFSQKDKITPFGVNYTPLVPDLTIAVDKNFIPLGSILLAQVPIVDEKGNLVRHENRFLLAQDVGCAIKGTGHVDLYMGEGNSAKKKIQYMNKYGKVWLLLPKQPQDMMIAKKM